MTVVPFPLSKNSYAPSILSTTPRIAGDVSFAMGRAIVRVTFTNRASLGSELHFLGRRSDMQDRRHGS